MVYNPSWLQWLLYAGIIILLPSITLSLIVGMYQLWTSGNQSNVGVSLFFTGVFAYTTVVFFPVVKYISVKVIHDEDGFTLVESNNNSTRYAWSDISKTKNNGILGVLRLYDNQGQCVYVVYRHTFGYKPFANKIYREVGIRS